MKTGRRFIIIGVLAFLALGPGSASAGAPDGFQYISDWGVYASGDDVFWHAGVQWKLEDGTWLRLQAGNWVPDPYIPAVIVRIPKDQAHCPPGLAKKGCVPPGQQKKAWGHRGHGQKWK